MSCRRQSSCAQIIRPISLGWQVIDVLRIFFEAVPPPLCSTCSIVDFSQPWGVHVLRVLPTTRHVLEDVIIHGSEPHLSLLGGYVPADSLKGTSMTLVPCLVPT